VITQAIVMGSVEVEKPALPELEETSGEAPVSSTRRVRWQDGDAETNIIRLEDVAAGHEIEGPAIVEHVATTFAIPPGRTARLDRHQIFHLSAGGSRD
jgi:N-methylhydantoinase A